MKQKNKTNFPGPYLALFSLPFVDQVLERSSKFASLLPHLLDTLDPCHWASVYSGQLRLILPKFPPDLFVDKSKGHFSDINWSFWNTWPCRPLCFFRFSPPKPFLTPCSLGFLMSLWLVVLKLFSLFSRICSSDLLFSFYTPWMILYSFPVSSFTPVLMAPISISSLISHLSSLFINPLAFWTLDLDFSEDSPSQCVQNWFHLLPPFPIVLFLLCPHASQGHQPPRCSGWKPGTLDSPLVTPHWVHHKVPLILPL